MPILSPGTGACATPNRSLLFLFGEAAGASGAGAWAYGPVGLPATGGPTGSQRLSRPRSLLLLPLELGLQCLHALFHGLELLQQHLVRRLGGAVVAGEHRRPAHAEHQRSNQHCRRGAAHALSVYAAELPLEAIRLTVRRRKKMRQKAVTDGHKQGLPQVKSDRGNPTVPTKRVIASTSFSHRFVIPSCQFRQCASSLHCAAPPPQTHQCSASMSCAALRNDGVRACSDLSRQNSGQAVLKDLSPTFAGRRIISDVAIFVQPQIICS